MDEPGKPSRIDKAKLTAFAAGLRRLMEAKGWGPNELADRAGVDRSLVSRHINGKVFANYRTRKEYAAALGLDIDTFESSWRSKTIPQHRSNQDVIPVLNRTSAGAVTDWCEPSEVDSSIGMRYIDRGDCADPNAFAVVVDGDSMKPTLLDGDTCVFSPAAAIGDGDIVFVRFSGDSRHDGCMICRASRSPGGDVVLTKDNPAYPPRVVRPEEIVRMSRIFEMRRPL